MPLTVGQKFTTDEDVFAALRLEVIDLAFTGNYATGGYGGGRGLLGFSSVLALVPLTRADTPANFVFAAYDMQSDSIRLYASGAAGSAFGEYGNAVATGFTVRCLVIGR